MVYPIRLIIISENRRLWSNGSGACILAINTIFLIRATYLNIIFNTFMSELLSDSMKKSTAVAKNSLILLLAVFTCYSCSKGKQGEVTPRISIQTVVQNRTTASSIFHFQVSLDKATSNAVTIHYTTAEGTAKENKDFKPATGTLTINANELTGGINVEVTGDSLRTDDLFFYVQLDNPQNCQIKTPKATGRIINSDGLYLPTDNNGYTSASSYPGYSLAWSDEFNSNTIDANSWTFENGNNNGWGNNELEFYTGRTQNAFASAGNLVLEARRETVSNFSYTSSRMISKGKRFFKFGRIDIRAKLPAGKGIWPALWMLGNNIDQAGWPACGA